MPSGVLGDAELPRVEAVAAQEGEIPEGEEVAAVLEELYLLLGDHDFAHVLHLLAQQCGEPFGVGLPAAVEEGVFHLGARIGLQYVVLAGEGVEVVVGEVCYQRLHGVGSLGAILCPGP